MSLAPFYRCSSTPKLSPSIPKERELGWIPIHPLPLPLSPTILFCMFKCRSWGVLILVWMEGQDEGKGYIPLQTKIFQDHTSNRGIGDFLSISISKDLQQPSYHLSFMSYQYIMVLRTAYWKHLAKLSSYSSFKGIPLHLLAWWLTTSFKAYYHHLQDWKKEKQIGIKGCPSSVGVGWGVQMRIGNCPKNSSERS